MVSELTKPSMTLDHLGDGAPPTSWWQMWSEERTARARFAKLTLDAGVVDRCGSQSSRDDAGQGHRGDLLRSGTQ